MAEAQAREDETDEMTKGTEGASKEVTPEEFITATPLYVEIPIYFSPPSQISFHCWNKTCAKETTWFRVYGETTLGNGQDGGQIPDYSLKSCAYKCFKCSDSVLTVVYKEIKRDKVQVRPRLGSGISNTPPTPPTMVEVVAQVMKIGQFPEPTVDLPRGLEKNLGNEAARFYRRALICRNNGFGLGAVTYMRRVVEDKTNELIELAAKYAESYEMDEATIKAIRAAADSTVYTTYDQKLKYASGVFPSTLMVESYNPLAILYGLVSEAIHSLSEEKCIVVADETAAVFDYVFGKLRADVTDRAEFVGRMKRLSQPKGSTPKPSTEIQSPSV
ncbi:MAG: hypothetical protein WCE63_08350 [Acidobacteriaceae bacterium]